MEQISVSGKIRGYCIETKSQGKEGPSSQKRKKEDREGMAVSGGGGHRVRCDSEGGVVCSGEEGEGKKQGEREKN